MSQRIPGHQADTILVKCLTKLLLCEVGMCFHLDKLGDDFPFRLQLFDVLALEVGNTDRLSLALFISFFQLAVTGKPVSGRLVDVQEIHVVHAEALKSLIHCVRVLILAGPELGGEEDLFTVHAALFHAASDSTFIHIGICRIDEAIAHLQCFSDAVFCICRGEHKGTDPDHRAGKVIIQGNVFHCVCPPYFNPIFLSHFSTSRSQVAALSPLTARPSVMFAPGQSLLISFSELEKPLPPWVISGQSVFPEKS